MRDFIKRDDVLSVLEKANDAFIRNGCVSDFITIDKLKTKVKHIPSADVRENVHGEWEIECSPDGTPYCLHCSVCDKEWAKISITSFYAYCPWCGAEMGGKTDG